MDYVEFRKNNMFDWYLPGAWEIYKCDIIHSFICTIPDKFQNVLLEVKCPLEGDSRGLYRRDEHRPNFNDCADCHLPWLLTNI